MTQDQSPEQIAAEIVRDHDEVVCGGDNLCPACERLRVDIAGAIRQAEARGEARGRQQGQAIAQKWWNRADRGFDPEELPETTAYWNGARTVAQELLASCCAEREPPASYLTMCAASKSAK